MIRFLLLAGAVLTMPQNRVLPVTAVVVSGTPVVLQSTQLDSAARSWNATLQRRGDASESLRWACLTSAVAPTIVVLLQSGEIDGGTIGRVDIHARGVQPALETRCVGAAFAPGSVVTDRGIRLGMTRDSVVHLLGKPTADTSGTWTYHAEVPYVHPRGATGFVQYSTLTLWVADGRVSRIRADYSIIN